MRDTFDQYNESASMTYESKALDARLRVTVHDEACEVRLTRITTGGDIMTIEADRAETWAGFVRGVLCDVRDNWCRPTPTNTTPDWPDLIEHNRRARAAITALGDRIGLPRKAARQEQPA